VAEFTAFARPPILHGALADVAEGDAVLPACDGQHPAVNEGVHICRELKRRVTAFPADILRDGGPRYAESLCRLALAEPLLLDEPEYHLGSHCREKPADHGVAYHDVAVPRAHAVTAAGRFW